MRIKKVSESIAIPEGHIIDSLQVASDVNAPSINAVNGAIRKIIDYSSEEVNTGAKWVDGKDIYRKSFEIAFNSTYSEGGFYYFWFNSGISNLHRIISTKGSIDLVSRIVSLGMTFNADFLNDSRIQLGLSQNFGSTKGTVMLTIEYTKK